MTASSRRGQSSIPALDDGFRMNQTRQLSCAATVAVFLFFGFLQIATAPTRDSYLNNYDHGYQLGVGVQLLHGKLPGIDILTHYGPMVFYSSAAWYWLSGSLLGETIACASAYALCLTIIYALLARHVSKLAGLSGASAAYLLEARFYKWYIWLFPLGTIWLLDQVSRAAPTARRRMIAATGLWVGLGWLYRWDVGTTGALACLLYLYLTRGELSFTVRVPWREWLVLGLACSVLPLAWFAYLLFERGPAGPLFFVKASLKGAVNLSKAMALPLPSFNPADPLSPASIIVLAYGLVIATYLICGLIGLSAVWRGSGSPRSRLLLAVALVGLSTFHQGYFRKGAFHLLQVIPPVLIGSCVLVSILYERVANSNGTGLRTRAVRFLGAAFLLGSAIAALGLVPSGRVDLSPFQAWPRQRLFELAHPLDAGAGANAPLLTALREVRAATDRDDPILVFPVDSQYLAFLNRPVSGRLTVFVPGFFDSGIEVEKNLEAIRKSMPKAVIVAPGVGGPDPARPSPFHQDSAKAHAYILRFIQENYPRKTHECDRCVVFLPLSLERDRGQIARGQGKDTATDRR
jgi:hypothetical protein